MFDEHPHELLAQVPLTVSPYLSLPAATTLPYTYKQLPSTLPPSVTDPPSAASNRSNTASPVPVTAGTDPSGGADSQQQREPAAYIRSASGGAATHPAALLSACERLRTHLSRRERESRERVREWEESIKARELAEKRRVAPGWLDAEQKLLTPMRKGGDESDERRDGGQLEVAQSSTPVPVTPDDTAGKELDQAFGALGMK